VRFPQSRVYPSSRTYRRRRPIFLPTVVLIAVVAAAYFYSVETDKRGTIQTVGEKIFVVDGDSFTVGKRKMRLDGIDAPEFRQMCRDEASREWPCGRAARAALEQILVEPGFTCEVETQDRYSRSLATCKTAHTADVAATQVKNGMAVTHEFAGVRDYGSEEDSARKAKLGIWRGEFERPEKWRAANPNIRQPQ
jgi:endonuclease YncB( thermonuclease family)